MDLNKFNELFDKIEKPEPINGVNDRVMLIDGMNLFIRNFAVLNYINESGVHIGGLGGFLRSLGSLIHMIKPTAVYMVFDGIGSSVNRKNIHPEYKSGRNITQLTNHGLFNNVEEELESKVDQISRLMHYMRCLPVNTVCIDKVEADDIIAFITRYMADNMNSKSYIVSADKDFLQLVDSNITVYRPIEKEFYTQKTIEDKFGVLSENFILYKTLLGDNSDKIKGIQGLGPKGINKKFPELSSTLLSLDDIFSISEKKYKEHQVYSRIILNEDQIRKNYRIMDLKNPLVDEKQAEYIINIIHEDPPLLSIPNFTQFYNEDGINKIIPNVSHWLRNTFITLDNLNKIGR